MKNYAVRYEKNIIFKKVNPSQINMKQNSVAFILKQQNKTSTKVILWKIEII